MSVRARRDHRQEAAVIPRVVRGRDRRRGRGRVRGPAVGARGRDIDRREVSDFFFRKKGEEWRGMVLVFSFFFIGCIKLNVLVEIHLMGIDFFI